MSRSLIDCAASALLALATKRVNGTDSLGAVEELADCLRGLLDAHPVNTRFYSEVLDRQRFLLATCIANGKGVRDSMFGYLSESLRIPQPPIDELRSDVTLLIARLEHAATGEPDPDLEAFLHRFVQALLDHPVELRAHPKRPQLA